MLGRIIRLQLDRIVSRVKAQHEHALSYDEAVVKLIASRCTEPESGGRMIDAILTNTLLRASEPRVARARVARAAHEPDRHRGRRRRFQIFIRLRTNHFTPWALPIKRC